MKEKDLMIVSLLRRNARETLTNLSKRTKIPVSTIYERLKKCDDGIIHKFTSLIDFSKLGYNARANIMLKAHKSSKKELKDYLKKHHQVNSFYKINNGYDYMIEGIFRHLNELEEFLESLEEKFEIENRNVYYIISDIKRESFMSDPKLLKLLD